MVAAMARTTSQRIKTFTIGFDLVQFDESPYAREVARLYDTDHNELQIGPSALEALPRIVWHYGEPFADSSAIPTFALAALASEQVTVALSGEGGDEGFGGYHRYLQLLRGDGATTILGRVRERLGRQQLTETDERVLAHYSKLLTYDTFNDEKRVDLYEPAFLDSLGKRDWRSVLADPYADSDAPDVMGRILDVDVQTFLSQQILVKVDIASMAHSLEVRTPLLDHVFLEAVAAIPTHTKLDASNPKRLYRDAVRGWLPDRLLDRPKKGFGMPLADWLRGGLRDLPAEILLDPRSLERGSSGKAP